MILWLAAAAAGQEVLTLDKAVATALEQNQMLRGAAHDVESSHWGKQAAYTNFLPRVSLDAGVTRIDPETELRANAALEFIRAAAGTFGIPSSALVNLKPFAYRDTYSAGITVVQSVYNGGAEIVGVRAADALQEKSDYGYQDTEQDVIARVRMSYYGVLAAQELVALAKENVERTKRYRESTTHRQELGMRTRTDVARWEVQLASDEGNRIKVSNLLASTRLQLNEVMGVELDREFTLEQIVVTADTATAASEAGRPVLYASLQGVAGFNAITASSLESHPSWRMMDANLRLAGIGIDRSWTNFQPRVNLAFQYGWEKNSTIGLDGYRPWALALLFSFPVFNGFGDYTNLQRAREEYQRTEAQVETFRRGLLMQARNAQLNVEAARQRIDVARKAQAQARDILAAVTRRYETGGASNVDLIDVQTAYTSAKTDFIRALYDCEIAKIQLARATGTVSR